MDLFSSCVNVLMCCYNENMLNDTWASARPTVDAVDRRERKLILVVVLIVGALAVAAVFAWFLGILQPQLDSPGGGMDASNGKATLTVEVTNRGVLSERVVGIDEDLPWVTVDAVRTVPEPIPGRSAGQLIIDVSVACDAVPESFSDSSFAVLSERPWGPVRTDATMLLSTMMEESAALACYQER